MDRKSEIQKGVLFDELLIIVENCKIKGIGKLACYDTVQRIGANINFFLNKYLHAGTNTGAEIILGKRLEKKFINRTDLPNPFHNKNLTNAEIEGILCIYKSRFEKFDF